MSQLIPSPSLPASAASRPAASPPGRAIKAVHRIRGVWRLGGHVFRQLQFGAKLGLLALTAVLPLTLLLGWQLWARYDDALQARIDATRQHVEVAQGVLQRFQAEEAAGRLTREQAQRQALSVVSGLRYDGQEYFWINDMQGVMVMHPMQPALDGTNVLGQRDPNGFPIFQAFIDVVRQDGNGVVHYQWPKPGETLPVDKISYVTGFPAWQWVLGSGVYVDDIHAEATRRLGSNALLIGLTMLLAAYLMVCFYKVMTSGLMSVRQHLRAMRDGDLTQTPEPLGRDESAQLLRELSDMQHALRGMVQRVRRSSDDILQSSGDIADGATALSARTEQTAANLEETAASMEEISVTAKHTSDHTSESARMARQSAVVAAQGAQVMRDVVQTMQAIQAASAGVNDVVGTINDIAFQTNLLALNAAVEAARTGEAGRGFAVVAAEVRRLAQHSAQAADEIKSLIQDSVNHVEAGVAVVRDASTAIEEIVSLSERVDQLLGEVAHGAGEQNLGITQVEQAVQELDRATQQNVVMVQRTVAAVEDLREDAATLAGAVARFHLPPMRDMAITQAEN